MKQFFILTFVFSIAIQSKAQNKNNSTPFVIGETTEIKSVILSEKRTLNIYLPEGYSEKDTTHYPVIYLLDGSADEDFIHIAGLVQFANFSWVHVLPKSIIVGIANVDRKRDFTFPTTVEKDKKNTPTSGSSANFIAFIEKELQPFVEKNYPTTNSKMIIGQSLGGLLATEILFKKPNLFNSYLIVSPSLWWDNESLLKVIPAFDKGANINVYVAVGKEGSVMETDAQNLAALLKKNELKTDFSFFPDEDHATIMHEAVYKGFKCLNPKKE